MTWDQWLAVLWLRWRLTVNQLHRGGPMNAIVLTLVLLVAGGGAVTLFVVGLGYGVFILPSIYPEQRVLLWDSIVLSFLFLWTIRFVSELQRSELISLDRLLHLPLTLKGMFLLNYASSLSSLPMALFVPGMVGLAIGAALTEGPRMLLLFPLLIGFLLMVTAVTYRLQGWLAGLMVNKRRRQAIITFVTAVFLLLAQAPWLVSQALSRNNIGLAASPEAPIEQATRLLGVANAFVPPGWFAYGALAAGESRIGPALLAALGTWVIGLVSLWWGYHATLRFYRGGFQQTRPDAVGAFREDARDVRGGLATPQPRARLLEWRLPVLSEPCAAIALANFRALTRAPEVKMILLTPLLIFAMLSFSLLQPRIRTLPQGAQSFTVLSVIGLTLFGLMGLVQNQFGFDRSGFRTFVLSGVPRREILLGKNVGVAAIFLGIGLLILGIMQYRFPMRLSHLVASTMQLGSLALLSLSVGNLSSILAPWAIGAGSLKPASPRGLRTMWNALFFVSMVPMIAFVTFFPLTIDRYLRRRDWNTSVSIYLVLAAAELAIVALGYRYLVKWQGWLLQRRETRILEQVTTMDE